MNTKELVPKLRDALKHDDNVLLAYLFGSRARGRNLPPSDCDIAVLMQESSLAKIGDVLFATSKALNLNEDKADILDLNTAPLHLKARVLREGIKLLDRGYEADLRQEVNFKCPEIATQLQIQINKWLNNPQELDLELIKDRLDYLLKTGEHTKSFMGRYISKELTQDFEAWHALKSMVQDLIQAMIDICAHIFSAKNLGIASSYREYVEKLKEGGYMKEILVKEVIAAIVMRSRLIHQYLTVKPEELWKFATKLAIEITPHFSEWVWGMTK